MTVSPRHLVVVGCGVIAAALAASVPQLPVRIAFEAIVAVATAVGVWRAGLALAPAFAKAESAAPAEPIDAVTYRRDRRNPIMDRDTGLFVDWYLRLRLEEEIARATRFDERFCVATFQSEPADRKAMLFGLKSSLRKVDYAAEVGGAVAVVLPNTQRPGAEVWRSRLPAAAQVASLVQFPDDGKTVSELLGEEQWAFRPVDGGRAA
jgi:hypothetical protein